LATCGIASSAVSYPVGSTQCLKGLCIKLDSVQQGLRGNSPDSAQPGTMLVSVKLTVQNNGAYPSGALHRADAYAGIFDGSLLYTSDNLFWPPFGGSVSGGTFDTAGPDYPKSGHTETGTIVFEILASEKPARYLYGVLMWSI